MHLIGAVKFSLTTVSKHTTHATIINDGVHLCPQTSLLKSITTPGYDDLGSFYPTLANGNHLRWGWGNFWYNYLSSGIFSIQLWQMAITWDGVEAIPSAGNGQRWSMLPSANTGQSGQTMRDDGNWMRIHIISFANNCSFEAGKHFFLNRRQKQWELMNTGEKPPHHHLMACYPFPRGGIFRLDQSNTTDAMGCVGLNIHMQRVMF